MIEECGEGPRWQTERDEKAREAYCNCLRTYIRSPEFKSCLVQVKYSSALWLLHHHVCHNTIAGALILSSYIPGGTGRLNPPVDSAVGRARRALEVYGRVKVADFPPVGVAKEWEAADGQGSASEEGAARKGGEEGRRESSPESLEDLKEEVKEEVKASLPHQTSLPRLSLAGTTAAAAAVAAATRAGAAAAAASEEAAVVARLIDGGLGANWPALDENTVLFSFAHAKQASFSILSFSFFPFRNPVPKYTHACTLWCNRCC